MVAVMVREHHCGDVGRRQSRAGECAGQLLLDRDVEAREGGVVRRRALAAVNEHEPPVVLDRPAKNGQRLRPRAGKNKSSCRRRPGLGWRKLFLTRTVPVCNGWIFIWSPWSWTASSGAARWVKGRAGSTRRRPVRGPRRSGRR